ncbi:calpain family cysteine protease domain-containing protein [Cyclospora cayetanensis]|uniref:Calpain family cysteine protease domain-containing protein n=1 Tax=Cyclospora cayetanensis TaxID=88456 RepID=A0A1D3D2H0_9EIME|nr:calpain family cysteine protease domain-containing protein [Cyclospora cayetanensis]
MIVNAIQEGSSCGLQKLQERLWGLLLQRRQQEQQEEEQREVVSSAGKAGGACGGGSSSRNSSYAQQLLLESSVVGPFLMLPWSESDKDIRCNFYVDCLPPDSESSTVCNASCTAAEAAAAAALAIQSQPVAVHCRVPPPKGSAAPFAAAEAALTPACRGFVGDCSFLSSLAVLSDYERRHGIPVVSSLIYPQMPLGDPSSGSGGGCCRSRPVYNPRGMYGVKLFFNGVPRKVLVDDFVPTRRDGKLLCAHSHHPQELWVSLLEKAFVKLMGGSYSMQGSNPGADLYHLTGWLPETIPFRSDVHTGTPASHTPIVTGGESEEVLKQQRQNPAWELVWFQLHRGLSEGRCVACLGTSEVFDAAPSGLEFPEGVSVSTGIVARHAYSVLRHAEVLGFRLLYVKNPWGCMRWRGKFSPGDKRTWTSELKEALDYDPAISVRLLRGLEACAAHA